MPSVALREVEETSTWPLETRRVRVAVLRKPGCEGPPEAGKVRLIAVESGEVLGHLPCCCPYAVAPEGHW